MRLKALSENGDRRADKALHIQDNPGDFLSTVQIGITLVGTAAVMRHTPLDKNSYF